MLFKVISNFAFYHLLDIRVFAKKLYYVKKKKEKGISFPPTRHRIVSEIFLFYTGSHMCSLKKRSFTSAINVNHHLFLIYKTIL